MCTITDVLKLNTVSCTGGAYRGGSAPSEAPAAEPFGYVEDIP